MTYDSSFDRPNPQLRVCG